jgi:hypothetical protein
MAGAGTGVPGGSEGKTGARGGVSVAGRCVVGPGRHVPHCRGWWWVLGDGRGCWEVARSDVLTL